MTYIEDRIDRHKYTNRYIVDIHNTILHRNRKNTDIYYRRLRYNSEIKKMCKSEEKISDKIIIKRKCNIVDNQKTQEIYIHQI